MRGRQHRGWLGRSQPGFWTTLHAVGANAAHRATKPVATGIVTPPRRAAAPGANGSQITFLRPGYGRQNRSPTATSWCVVGRQAAPNRGWPGYGANVPAATFGFFHLLLLASEPASDLASDLESGPIGRPAGTMGAGLGGFAAQADPSAATTCPDGQTLPGIDVSKWQGDIDWNAVAGDGIVYAIVRATHGVNTIDEWFDSNWNESRAAGLYVGVYQYFEPGQDPIAQADLMLEMMGPLGPEDLPPVIDVESHGDLPPAEVASAVAQWITHVEAQTGIKPIIYTGRYFWQDYVQSPAFADYPLWIAHYTDACPNIPDQWSDWAFHQYTDSGSVAGVPGNVDRNDFNGDLAALAGLFAAPAECGDALCSGDENADACAVDCPPCGTIAAAGGDLDDGDACFELAGSPEYWRHVTEGEQGDSVWTAVTDFDTPSNYARAELHFAEAGRYQIEAHLVGAYAQSTLASYAVTHTDGTTAVPVDQSTQSGWISLGEFDFSAGGHDQAIRLDDNTGEPTSVEVRLGIDAFRLTRLDLPDAAEDTGNDSSGGQGSDAGDEETSEAPDENGNESESDGGFSDEDTGVLPPFDGEAESGCGCATQGGRAPLGLVVIVASSAMRSRRRRR